MNHEDPKIAAVFDALEAPFEPHEVKRREGDRGRLLSYIEDSTAKRRLDQVLGRDRWECDVTPCEGGVKCRITITLPDGREISRAALGGYAEMKSREDSFKSGDTDAFKRACARFGIGAYLREENHGGPRQQPQGRQDKPRGQWGGAPAQRPARAPARSGPAPGKPGLYGRLKDAEASHPGGQGLLAHMSAWGQREGFPGRINDWTAEQVRKAEAEARAYLQSEPAYAE